jgi:hypothetical protein
MGKYLDLVRTVNQPKPEDRALPEASGENGPGGKAEWGGTLRPGCWVEWLSPALPTCRGEVLAVYPDGTCQVFHPLTEHLCRLPVAWVTAVFEQPPREER